MLCFKYSLRRSFHFSSNFKSSLVVLKWISDENGFLSKFEIFLEIQTYVEMM